MFLMPWQRPATGVRRSPLLSRIRPRAHLHRAINTLAAARALRRREWVAAPDAPPSPAGERTWSMRIRRRLDGALTAPVRTPKIAAEMSVHSGAPAA